MMKSAPGQGSLRVRSNSTEFTQTRQEKFTDWSSTAKMMFQNKGSVQNLHYPVAPIAFPTPSTHPQSPGFWHCAHKHDSQFKRQAKRFCKPFIKHYEVLWSI